MQDVHSPRARMVNIEYPQNEWFQAKDQKKESSWPFLSQVLLFRLHFLFEEGGNRKMIIQIHHASLWDHI